MRKNIALAVAVAAFAAPVLVAAEPDQTVVTMDEDLWVTFYDVPSRRFREIRSAFVRRDFARAALDLRTSASYLTVESERALPAIAERLNELISRISWISENIENSAVTVADFDALFSRAHWLLAQHYIDMARRSRDNQQNRNAGLYLWATTHHLERAVLWSNARISRDVQKTLDDLRDLADQLQDKNRAAKAYREKPLLRADKLLRKLGEIVDRPVVLPAP